MDDRFGSISYGELAPVVSRLGAALQARGIARGDRFVVALPNWQHAVAFVLALNSIGAVTVHLPVTGGEREFTGVIKVSEAKGIVAPAEFRGVDFAALIGGIAGKFEHLTTRVTVGTDEEFPGWVRFDQLLADAPADDPVPGQRADASDLTSLLFTSGSSGDPKGVMHSSNTLGALNTTVAPLYDMGPDDVIFMGAPLGFSAGLVHGLRLAIFLGATLILQESWSADRALETMAREKATFTLTTPTLLRDLFASERFPKYADHLCLQLIFCGGAYVSSGLLRSAHEKLPKTLTSVIWGMTEGIGTGSRPDTSLERVIETDGRPFLGTELKVVREDGSDADPDEQGDLLMRGPQRFLGYFKQPELNEEVFLPGGWFQTGDVAAIDSEGYLKITARRKELIIRGGANIAPAEVEEVLVDDPRIQGVAVVDMPDERLGERVCACVVASEKGTELTLADVVEIARRKGLAKNKWPERLEIMESLPLTPAGKVQRTALREYVRSRIAAEDAGAPA